MSRSFGLLLLAGGTMLGAGVVADAALALDPDPYKYLQESSSLIQQQQDIEAQLSANRAKLQELQYRRGGIQYDSGRNLEDLAITNSLCSRPDYRFGHSAECSTDSGRLSSRGSDLSQEQTATLEQIQAVNREIERLTVRKRELEMRNDSVESTLKRMEFSGMTQECIDRQPTETLRDRVSTYERCWSGTSDAQPRFKSDPSKAPILTPGPIEQMGIEDEQRRRRKARQKAERGE